MTSGKTTEVVRDVFTAKETSVKCHQTGFFSSKQALPPGTVFAVRDRRAGRLDRSDLRLRHDAGWREGCSLARARVARRAAAVAPADLSNGAMTNPRKKGVYEHRIFDGGGRSRDAPNFDAIRSPRVWKEL